MEPDIVRVILEKVLQAAARASGGFDETMALEIERQVRHEFGGDEVYVRRDVEYQQRRDQALAEAKTTGRPMEAASRHGIARSTMYRLLGKK